MQPLRTKGWDKALVEFTAAMLTDTEAESKPSLSKRLTEISCPGKLPDSIYLNGKDCKFFHGVSTGIVCIG